MFIDLDKFKATPPWLDLSFWAALVWSVAMGVMDYTTDHSVTQTSVTADSAALIAFLLSHGYVRGKGAEAAGRTAAAPEYARLAIVQGETPTAVTEDLLPETDDADEMPEPQPGHLLCCPTEGGF